MPSHDVGARPSRPQLSPETAAVSGPPPREKGPLVFLDYTQAELDAAYDQAAYHADIQQLRDRWHSNSARTRARIGPPLRRRYGPSAIEELDIFRTDAPAPAPVFVFIHGGAWRAGSAKQYSAPAEMFVRAGAHYVAPDFATVQDAGGSLFPMAEQVCRAIAWVYRNAASFGGDPDRIYVGGHSSGAHLAAVALTTDWQRDFGLPPDLIKGGLCGSGMYDLAPVRLSHRSSYVNFTDEMVETLSPHPPSRAAAGAGDRRLRHLTRPPSSSARRATSPPRCATPASRSS